MQRKLIKCFVYREPLSLPTYCSRILPLSQFFSHCHHVHFCPMLMFTILKQVKTVRNVCYNMVVQFSNYYFEDTETSAQLPDNASLFQDLSGCCDARFFLRFHSATWYYPLFRFTRGCHQKNLLYHTCIIDSISQYTVIMYQQNKHV